MEAILKFIENTSQKNSESAANKVISRTMLKIAVVSRHFIQKNDSSMNPKHGELWRCRIVKEIQSGKNRGCFIVEPMEKISDDSLMRLVPGWYETKLVRGRLVITPKEQGHNWILPLTHKRMMSEEQNAYCVIVRLDSVPDDPTITGPEDLSKSPSRPYGNTK